MLASRVHALAQPCQGREHAFFRAFSVVFSAKVSLALDATAEGGRWAGKGDQSTRVLVVDGTACHRRASAVAVRALWCAAAICS